MFDVETGKTILYLASAETVSLCVTQFVRWVILCVMEDDWVRSATLFIADVVTILLVIWLAREMFVILWNKRNRIEKQLSLLLG